MALRTGCWLFIGAQHANAKGPPLHYASPRLRRDGREGTNDLATEFLELMKHVSDARKVDLLEVSTQLRKSQEEATRLQEMKNDAEVKLQTANEELGALKDRNERDAKLIREYQERLGLVPN